LKLAIVQLSDIHIKSEDDSVLRRAHPVVSAINNCVITTDAYLLAITGDVANSGAKAQYDLALKFLASVAEELRRKGKPVHCFVIPGNHDLDLSDAPDTRDALISHVRKNTVKVDASGETVNQIISVQRKFFDFEATLLNIPVRPNGNKLVYVHNFDVDGHKIRVKCLNTAWISTNPEIPANLVFPCHLITREEDRADIEIVAFHHPSNWLSPDNARAFRIAVEGSSDLMMTGHEHESSFYSKQSTVTGATDHIEGAVLQEHTTGRSAFNVIIVDQSEASCDVHLCTWIDDRYVPKNEGHFPLLRNRLARKTIFQNTSEYSRFLANPGLPILHPRKHDVQIVDLFVYPALASKDPDHKFQIQRVIGSQQVLEFVRTTPRLMIVGNEICGKTCMAKSLYRDLQEGNSLVPLLLNGRDINGFRESDLRRLIRDAVETQYGRELKEPFLSIDPSQRVIIVDDWHELRFAAKGKSKIVEFLKGYCGKLILLSSRLYAFEELADTGPSQRMFSDFEFCEIKEFGKWATSKLIEKWHLLGQEESLDLKEFHFTVASSEDKVATVIRKGILPTYPIFIIGLLQADASQSSSASQNAGAYGHILELLITDRLSQVSKIAADIGTMYTHLSRVAYFLFKKDRDYFSPKEFSEIHSEYCKLYKMKLAEERMISNFCKAKIIYKEGGVYKFAYKGVYCYCVARYFFENLARAEVTLRTELNEMVDRLAWEDYSNIVMFYLYLSRDPKTIDQLLANAAKIYEECAPASLDVDVDFVNHLIKGTAPTKVVLPTANIAANKEEFLKRQDAAEIENGPGLAAPNNRVPYASELHELVKITIAMQTLRVMGQVLRNFPGVLTGEPKYRLAEASYLLGLRTLRRVLDLARSQVQELRVAFADIFKEKHPLVTQEEVAESADQSIIWLTGAAAYGVIKRICRSVGLQELELTFEEVGAKLGSLASVRLIDLSIHLEYFRDAPKVEIYQLEKDLHKNYFSYKILRDLVSEFLYLRNTDASFAQEIGELLDIEASKPEFQMNKAVGVQHKAKLLRDSEE
jgi:predicted MPP superfamily phosphohydrolase